MKMNIKKIGLALVSVSLLSAAVSPTVIPAYVASTSKSKIVKINGTKMTMKQFERKLKKAKIVNYTSKKKIDMALKKGGKVKQSTKPMLLERGAVPIVAAMTIPGIGKVVLTAAGAILVGGVVVSAGSVLYNKLAQLFAKNSGKYKGNKKKKDHRVHQSKSNKNRHQNGQTRKYKSEKKKSRKNWKHNK